MTGWKTARHQCRLPVFFVLDNSEDMQRIFYPLNPSNARQEQRIDLMQSSFEQLKDRLMHHALGGTCVNIGILTFSERIRSHRCVPLRELEVPHWKAQGRARFKPAFESLIDELNNRLQISRPIFPGHYAPLIFLVVGSYPQDFDEWQSILGQFTAFTDNRRPIIITLIARKDPQLSREDSALVRLLHMMSGISHSVLMLKEENAVCISQFFDWATVAIASIVEYYHTSNYPLAVPILPSPSSGVVEKVGTVGLRFEKVL